MSINYTHYSFQLYGHMMQLKQLLAPLAGDEQVAQWIRQIDEQQQRITTRKFRVAVLGEFRRGKSSFINALLGREVLPADALPTTATINRVTYGDHPRVTLRFKDGREETVAIDALADYVTKLNPGAEQNASEIDEAVVEYPSMFCRNNVDLIDTPGLNDDEQMNTVTISRVDQVDLAIVAISVEYPLSQTEAMLLTQLLETPHICRIIVVVTMMDKRKPAERERMLTFLRERIAEKVKEQLVARHEAGDPIFQKYDAMFEDFRLYGLSSRYAAQSLQTNDMQLFEQSGYRQLNQELPALLVAEQAGGSVRSTLGVISQIAYDFSLWPQRRQAILEEASAQLQAIRQDFARCCYQSIKDEENAWEKIYGTRIVGVESLMTQQRDCISETWKKSKGTEMNRAAAVMAQMVRIFKDSNDLLLEELGSPLQTSLAAASAGVRLKLIAQLQPLVDHPLLAEHMAKILEELSQPLAWPEDAAPPSLFYWAQHPEIHDVISLEHSNAAVPIERHPYLLRTNNALKISIENCIVANNTRRKALIGQLQTAQKDRVQQIVMGFFRLAGELDKQVQEGRSNLAAQHLVQDVARIGNECRAVQEHFEAELARERNAWR